MPVDRRLIKWTLALALFAGGAFGLLVTFHGYQMQQHAIAERGDDWFHFDGWRILECGAGVVAVLLTLAFASCVLLSRPPTMSIPIYIAAYLACSQSAWLALLIAGKNFDGRGVGANLVGVGAAYFIPAVLATVVGLVLSLRSSANENVFNLWLAIYVVAALIGMVIVPMQDHPLPPISWALALIAVGALTMHALRRPRSHGGLSAAS